jgi:hypothetical protein
VAAQCTVAAHIRVGVSFEQANQDSAPTPLAGTDVAGATAMTLGVRGPDRVVAKRWDAGGLPVGTTATLPVKDVSPSGPGQQPGWPVGRRGGGPRRWLGPNAMRAYHVRTWAVLGRQLRSALLVLSVVPLDGGGQAGANPLDAAAYRRYDGPAHQIHRRASRFSHPRPRRLRVQR